MGAYHRFVNPRIIEDNDRAWPWIRIAKWKQIMLDELRKNVLIDSAFIDVANNITVYCEGRKKAEVRSTRCSNFGACSLAFWGIAIAALTQFRVDARFIKKNKLRGIPIRQLLEPVVTQ